MRRFWETGPLRVTVGELEGAAGVFHVPRVLPGGVFAGENGLAAGGGLLVLDDGSSRFLSGDLSVDHDSRVIRLSKEEDTDAGLFSPPAVLFERTAERRSVREPTRDDGAGPVTGWTYTSGQERDIVPRGNRFGSRRYFNQIIRYDGGPDTEQDTAVQSRTITAWDFGWTANLFDRGELVSRDALAYRTVTATGPGQGALIEDSLIQVLIEDVWLDGDWSVGRNTMRPDREIEVAAVLEQEQQDGAILRTRVNRWLTIARLTRARPLPGYEFTGEVPEDATPEFTLFQGESVYRLSGWVRWVPSPPVDTLRDIERGPFPPPPEPDPLRWTGAGGAVQVTGPPGSGLPTLDNATLTAYGRSFTGGTWATLRDVPIRLPDSTLDFTPHLILHASASTVTAIRPNGQALSIPRAVFEADVLRVPPGGFQQFSSVGTLFNTWPPQWTWCNCDYINGDGKRVFESRAVSAHDAWRDDYKRGAPPDSPAHWSWPGRPRRRPLSGSGLPAPLGLTLADVTGTVIHDELLARGAGPLLLPTAATSGGVDVRVAVTKRFLYQPASWPEELDDGRSCPGPLTLTFSLPPSPGAGQTWKAALLLRFQTRDELVKVNGVDVPLIRLGHNAAQARAWQPYVLRVPVSSTYTLEYSGKCSRALLCVRTLDLAAGP